MNNFIRYEFMTHTQIDCTRTSYARICYTQIYYYNFDGTLI